MNMIVRDYKKCLWLAIGCCGFFILCGAGAVSSTEDDRITRDTLRRVEAVSKSQPSLERFGKSTLAESAILLDLGAGAAPGLILYLKDRKKDWKMRFWAADMLGYVGDEGAVKPLRKIAESFREKKEVRKRARVAIKEIERRFSASRSSSHPSE